MKAYDSKVQVNESITLSSLLPSVEDMGRFYTYIGSLTTPPCSEVVTWILFPDPLPISAAQVNFEYLKRFSNILRFIILFFQMKKFRLLQADEHSTPLINNYRNIQKRGPRRVFVRKMKDKYLTHEDMDWLQ